MLRLAIPLVLAELGWMTMAIVDTMMVGRQAHSAEAIGAVSLGSILFNAVAIFGTGLMLGLDTLVSHSYGAGDVEDCHHSLVNGVYLSFAITPFSDGDRVAVRTRAPLARYSGIGAESSDSVSACVELGYAAAVALLCLSPLSPRHEPGQAGDVRSDFREFCEPRGELGARVRSSRVSGDGDCGFGMVHLYGANLHDELCCSFTRCITTIAIRLDSATRRGCRISFACGNSSNWDFRQRHNLEWKSAYSRCARR